MYRKKIAFYLAALMIIAAGIVLWYVSSGYYHEPKLDAALVEAYGSVRRNKL